MHKRSAPDVFTKNALRCGKDNIFVPRRFHGAASGLRANSPTSPNTLFLSTSATLTSILNSPLPPTALNYHNKRKPHLSSKHHHHVSWQPARYRPREGAGEAGG
jgi:hypothetical protein